MWLSIHKKINLANDLYYRKLIIFKNQLVLRQLDAVDRNCYSQTTIIGVLGLCVEVNFQGNQLGWPSLVSLEARHHLAGMFPKWRGKRNLLVTHKTKKCDTLIEIIIKWVGEQLCVGKNQLKLYYLHYFFLQNNNKYNDD